MLDNLGKLSSSNATPAKLQICFFYAQQQLLDLVRKLLSDSSYELTSFDKIKDLTNFVIDNCEQIDCLIFSSHAQLELVGHKLQEAEIFLPAVILSPPESIDSTTEQDELVASLVDIKDDRIYHRAEIGLYFTQIKEITDYISLAIKRFISLAADDRGEKNVAELESTSEPTLISQQRRLTEKLKERLSYLGFFCKRNPDYFWSNLSRSQQQELTTKTTQRYRQILLLYFDRNCEINKLIDDFVDRAFFADISTSQILEIHMKLIDDFSHQLQIEGRSNDILLDYRLPLIDVIAHLCEMYRRSIPGSDGSMNLPFALE